MARVILYNTTIQQNTSGGITIKDNQNYKPVGDDGVSNSKPVVKPSVKKSSKKRKSKK